MAGVCPAVGGTGAVARYRLPGGPETGGAAVDPTRTGLSRSVMVRGHTAFDAEVALRCLEEAFEQRAGTASL